MKHSFLPGLDNKDNCRVIVPTTGLPCNRTLMQHTSIAECESCENKAECEIYDGDILLCWDCKDKQLDSLMSEVEQHAADTRIRRELTIAAEEARALERLQLKEDIFNSEIISFAELRKQVELDESIPQGEEKDFAFTKLVADRIVKYRALIWKKEDELLELKQRELANVHHLREFEGKVRQEIRELIKQNDSLYKPQIPKAVREKQKKDRVKMSPLDRIVESVASANNISMDEARKLVYANPSIMGTNTANKE